MPQILKNAHPLNMPHIINKKHIKTFTKLTFRNKSGRDKEDRAEAVRHTDGSLSSELRECEGSDDPHRDSHQHHGRVVEVLVAGDVDGIQDGAVVDEHRAEETSGDQNHSEQDGPGAEVGEYDRHRLLTRLLEVLERQLKSSSVVLNKYIY